MNKLITVNVHFVWPLFLFGSDITIRHIFSFPFLTKIVHEQDHRKCSMKPISPLNNQKLKGNVRGEKKHNSHNASYKSLTNAIIRISETGHTSDHDQMLLDLANRRVAEELYGGNLHVEAGRKLMKSSPPIPPCGDKISRKPSIKDSGNSMQRRARADRNKQPVIRDAGVAGAPNFKTDHLPSNIDINSEMDSNCNRDTEIAELDYQFRMEFYSEPKRPTLNHADRNQTSAEMRKRLYKGK